MEEGTDLTSRFENMKSVALGFTHFPTCTVSGHHPFLGLEAMCGDHEESSRGMYTGDDGVPDWENLVMPPDHVLSHLTDAHCHPTDLDISDSDYAGVRLGGLGAMATVPEDQDKVRAHGTKRGWRHEGRSEEGGESSWSGVKVVSCFGYHPWFTHRYTLVQPPPSKEEHYTSIFFKPKSSPSSKNRELLRTLLPYLPEPIPFDQLLADLRRNIRDSLADGRLTMLGEVGLDGGARVRWPLGARHLYTEKYGSEAGSEDKVDDQGEWKRLTPFKTNMAHQREVVERQLDVAVEEGVNVSFHSVAAAGPTLEVLCKMRDKYGPRFTDGINVDIHSAGGWSPEFWRDAEKQLSNLYASPSIYITGRSASAADLIRAISPPRMLVESDTHDIRQTTRLVYAACEWIARCRGWRLEGKDGELVDEWDPPRLAKEEDNYTVDAKGRVFLDDGQTGEGDEEEVWTVKLIERNWARFMRLNG